MSDIGTTTKPRLVLGMLKVLVEFEKVSIFVCMWYEWRKGTKGTVLGCTSGNVWW